MLQDSPKLWKWKLKHPWEMIFESQLKSWIGVETPGLRTEVEVWRKKCGMTQELNRGMWLEMRLGSGQERSHPKPCKQRSTSSSVIEWNQLYMECDLMVWNNQMHKDSSIAYGVHLLTEQRVGPKSRAGHLTPAKLVSGLLAFSMGIVFFIACKFLKTMSLLQIINHHSYQARLSFHVSS